VKHMCTHLLTNAFSVILRDWYDFGATLSGPPSLNYPMAAVSDSLMIFTGSMSEAVRNTIGEYGEEDVRPGDVIICNDPYRTGTHPNDLLFVRPIFHEDELVGFVNIQPHMMDMGGIVPAGFSPAKKNVYENGLVIPPTLLYRDDKPVRSTFALIFDNARFGEVMLPDIQSIYAEPADFARHVAKLEAHLQTHPEDRDGWLMLGALWYLSGRTQKAADVFLRLSDRKEDPTLRAFLSATKAGE